MATAPKPPWQFEYNFKTESVVIILANRKRKNRIDVFLSDDEKDLLNERLKSMSIKNKSEYIRKLILNGYIINIDLSIINKFISTVSRVANNINQITRKLNTFNNISNEEIQTINKLLSEILENQKSIIKSLNKNLKNL